MKLKLIKLLKIDMTKTRKRRLWVYNMIYHRLLYLDATNGWNRCNFCAVLFDLFGGSPYLLHNLPELWIERPSYAQSSYWFDKNQKGLYRRLDIILTVISKYKK